MFGFRVWSLTDMADVDADDLHDMVKQAEKYEKELRKKAAEERRRGR